MVPRLFTLWSGLFVLATTMGRRIYVDHQHFQIRPNLYITLVGEQGTRKGSAKDAAQAMFCETFPSFPIGASVMSREQIVARMSHVDNIQSFTDETGTQIEWHPLTFFVNELKNFMSINPSTMVEFLTDIYDRKFFAADTIKHGLQPIVNPCINILACETPEWIIEKMKYKITTGGFSRRMLYAYETERVPRRTFAHKSKEAYEAEGWCKQHLLKIEKIAGPFTWTQEARVEFDKWFVNLPYPDDRIIAGFYEAKDVLATKIAMLCAMAQEEPKLELSWPLMQQGIAILETIEVNLNRLTVAAGRNELSVPQSQILQKLKDKGGWMPEKEFHRIASADMSEREINEMKSLLKSTDQLYEHHITCDGYNERMVLNHQKFTDLVKSGGIKIQ